MRRIWEWIKDAAHTAAIVVVLIVLSIAWAFAG